MMEHKPNLPLRLTITLVFLAILGGMATLSHALTAMGHNVLPLITLGITFLTVLAIRHVLPKKPA